MKRALTAALLILASLSLCAQTDWKEIAGRMKTNKVSADYRCAIDINGTKVLFAGSAAVEGKCFHLTGNGIEVWCDGTALLYADSSSKEAYIQQASDIHKFVADNFKKVSDLELTNVRYEPLSEDLSAYALPLGRLGSDWVITNMTE